MNDAYRPVGALSDVELNERERSQLDLLFRTQAPGLLRFFSRRTGDRENARDLVQDVFVRLLGARPAEPLRSPEAYIQRIARNLLIDKARRAQPTRDWDMPLEDQASIAVGPEQATAQRARELQERYQVALAELTTRTREVFLLHRADELSYKAIGQKLGISLGTVEYHMTRALVHLDRALSEE